MNDEVKFAKKGGVARNSSIELFRIIIMLVIIAHHYIVNSGIYDVIKAGDVLSAASIFSLIFGFGGKIGINCFVLITGYFMCKSQISIRKYVKLFLEVQFYMIVFMLIFHLSGYEKYGIKKSIMTIVPFYYVGTEFLSTYLLFYFFIPYFNLFLSSLDEVKHRNLLILLLVSDSILQTFLKIPKAFTYFGWFVTVYFIAAYIRLCRDENYKNKWTRSGVFYNFRKWLFFTACIVLISWASIITGALIYSITGKDIIYYFVIDSNKFLSILLAVSAFLTFLNMNIKHSKMINMVASSVFGVLLIHANSDIMRRWLWEDLLNCVGMYKYGLSYPVQYAFGAILVVAVVFLVCAAIDILRQKLFERPVMNLVDKICERLRMRF